MTKEQQFYLVDFSILPEAIKKTIRVKEMLKSGSSGTINEAVHKVNMSRSGYYKYKDHVASADDDKEDRVVVLFIIMQDDMAVFGRILRRIAKEKQEVLSVNRTKISEKLYSSVITLKTKESAKDMESLYEALKETKGIQSLTMKIGGEFKFGTVGSGVAETIRKNGRTMEDSIGCHFNISHVLVRHPEKYRDMELLQGIHLTSSFEDIISDESIDIVIEVMGGIHPAKEYIFEALNHHINVVSANKDLVALFGPEIMHTAMENHVNFSCEASVGGGIPILRPLHDSLAANEIESIVGIVNGTTNFILSNMDDAGVSYGDALRVAQKKGYAEADPTNDVACYDAARKLAILASIGFHANVTFDDVLVEGIEKISQNDVQYASEMGYTIKLLAVAIRQDNGIALNVYPAFVPRSHPLASVKGSYNAIYVTGNIVDDVMFYGRGAGSLPTASAVMGDVISTAKHIMNHSTGTDMMLTETKRIPFYSSLKLENSYYFRLIVDDVTGVLSQIASAYADNDISIKEVVQKSRIEDAAELMIITEKTPRENIIHVEKALQVLPCMRQVANIVRVMEDDRK